MSTANGDDASEVVRVTTPPPVATSFDHSGNTDASLSSKSSQKTNPASRTGQNDGAASGAASSIASPPASAASLANTSRLASFALASRPSSSSGVSSEQLADKARPSVPHVEALTGPI